MKRPNFLVFVTDQMQALDAVHACGIATPNIDRIAGGTSFRRSYCPNPVCMPSRASILTGLTPRQHGAISNGTPLPTGIPTLGQALLDAGYRTHAVGKLHLQSYMGDGPHRQRTDLPFSWEDEVRWRDGEITALPSPYYGFESADFLGGHVQYVHGSYVNWLEERAPGSWASYSRAAARSRIEQRRDCWRLAIPEELHYNTWIADRSIDYLDRADDDHPFLLWCSFPDPHFPFAACSPYSERYDPASLQLPATRDRRDDPCPLLADLRQRFAGASGFSEAELREITAQTAGMIAHVDHCVGRVLDRLEADGLADNTIVVFLSDHGEYLGAHHLLYKSAWPYEELYRVPFLWRAPGGAENGGCDDVVSLLDFTPTILDYAGIETSTLDMRRYGTCQRPTLPGRSLRPRIDAATQLQERPALIDYDSDGGEECMLRMRTIVSGRYKLSIFAGTGQGLLFDLEEDPQERRSRWDDATYREIREALVLQLVEELARSDRLDVERISGA